MAGMALAGQIVINLLPDGQVVSQYNGPSPLVLLGMLDVSKDQLLAKITHPDQGPKVELAPPGLKV